MKTRRSFVGILLGLVGAASAQKAIIAPNGHAVICGDESVTCPVCKQKTCKVINAPIVVGNDNHNYPDQSQLFDYHILRCDNCLAAFFRE
jgi:hypothetical protein